MAQTQNKGIPHVRVIAINGSAGAAKEIDADIGSVGYVEIAECPADGGAFNGSFTAQGLNFQEADDNFTDTQGLAAGAIWVLGTPTGPNHEVAHASRPLPDGSTIAASAYMKNVKSATVTATFVSVKEWPQR